MHTLARFSLALLLLIASTTFAPRAHALRCHVVYTEYFDCALNSVGWELEGCDESYTSSGQLSGAFKEVEVSPCVCSGHTDTYYQWNGSSWVLLSGPPSPSC